MAPYEMENLQMGGKKKVKFNLTSYNLSFFVLLCQGFYCSYRF